MNFAFCQSHKKYVLYAMFSKNLNLKSLKDFFTGVLIANNSLNFQSSYLKYELLNDVFDCFQ